MSVETCYCDVRYGVGRYLKQLAMFCLCISQGCSRLKHLDVSWNQLTHTREELGIMRKHVITLTYLDTRNNPWQKVKITRD